MWTSESRAAQKKTQEAKMGECISDMRLGVTSIVACGLYLFFLDLNESTYLLPLQLRDVLEGCWGVCYVFLGVGLPVKMLAHAGDRQFKSMGQLFTRRHSWSHDPFKNEHLFGSTAEWKYLWNLGPPVETNDTFPFVNTIFRSVEGFV